MEPATGAPGPLPNGETEPSLDLPLVDGIPSHVDLGNVEDLCNHILDPNRTRVLAVLAPSTASTPGPVDATRAAEQCRGLADVIAITDHQATFAITNTLGREFTCFDGAVRIIPPLRPGPPLPNWILLGRKLAEMSQQDALDLVEGSASKARHLYAQNAPRRPPHAAKPAPPRDPALPRRVTDALARAGEQFHNLAFLKSAHESAAASPYRWPEKVIGALAALDTAGQRLAEATGLTIRDVLKELGYGTAFRSGISDRTDGQWGDAYRFQWNGAKTLFDQHLTLGAGMGDDRCISIHFLRDPATAKIVIAYVGNHLRNTKTN